MVIDFKKYIMSTGKHYIANSGHDENNKYHGGAAGDQTGHEFELKGWYSRPWTVVLRWPDPAVGLKIAQLGIAAALNDKIGYDQYQRKSYWTQLEKAGYDPSKITTACEEDCTAGVTANCKAAGYLLGIKALQDLPMDTYSGNMKSRFVRAGFKALTDKKYLTSSSYLLPGDVLLYESHHGATNITYGKSVRPKVAPVLTPISGGEAAVTPSVEPEGLHRGDHGTAVEKVQRALLIWDAACLPEYGADGDFGEETEKALKAYQKAAELPVTGVYDEATRKALTSIGTAQRIEATADVYVRSAPGKDNRELGVLKQGQAAPYQGEKSAVDGRDWYLIEFDGKNGWVSSKYSKVV
jgi:peptidoglycan hydrolase-like protein with peptidoglycan-binding domain